MACRHGQVLFLQVLPFLVVLHGFSSVAGNFVPGQPSICPLGRPCTPSEATPLNVVAITPAIPVLPAFNGLATPGPAPSPLANVPNSASSPLVGPSVSQQGPAPAPLAAAPVLSPPSASTPVPQSTASSAVTVVIAAGGASSQTRTSSVIYTSAGTWSPGPSFSSATLGRQSFPMVQLSATQVLAVGGDFSGASTAETYSTVSGVWQATSPMQAYRSDNGAVKLADGSVFTAGGYDDSAPPVPQATSERYSVGSWIQDVSLEEAKARYTMLLYQNAGVPTVQICGGLSGNGSSSAPTDACEEFDASTSPMTAATPSRLIVGVSQHRAVLLNGDPFIAGGLTTEGPTNTTQWKRSGSWQVQTSLGQARYAHEMLTLPNNQVLACGGVGRVATDGGILDTCEIFDGTSWTMGPRLLSAMSNFRMVLLENGDVLYLGPAGNGEPHSATWTPGTAIWLAVSGSESLDSRTFFGMAPI